MSYEDLNKQLEPFKLMVFDEGTEDVWATLVLWLNEDYNKMCLILGKKRDSLEMAMIGIHWPLSS